MSYYTSPSNYETDINVTPQSPTSPKPSNLGIIIAGIGIFSLGFFIGIEIKKSKNKK